MSRRFRPTDAVVECRFDDIASSLVVCWARLGIRGCCPAMDELSQPTSEP